MAKSEKAGFREELTEKIIADLEKGVIPWEKPWEAGEANFTRPYNAVTGREYNGGNAFALFYSGNTDPRWATFKQIQDAGWKVQAGSKGTRIEFWTIGNEKQAKDENGKPVKDAEGKPVKEKYEYSRPVSRTYYVFNGSQIEGIPPLPEKDKEQQKWDSVEKADQIIKNSKATIHHDQADRAFYRSSTDSIHLPDKANFPDKEKYYGTVLHELGHWTGHQTRLNRDLGHGFGSEQYAKEELRAELASAFLSMETGVKPNIGQHAAYIQSWVKVLKDDKHEIFRASRDADKITEYVMEFGRDLKQEQSLERAVGKETPMDVSKGPKELVAYISQREAIFDSMKAMEKRRNENQIGRDQEKQTGKETVIPMNDKDITKSLGMQEGLGR